MTHTPGPWHTERRRATIAIAEGKGLILAEVYGQTTLPDLGRANARLMAAAPDLLVACESVVGALRGPLAVDLANVISLLEGAIALATKGA